MMGLPYNRYVCDNCGKYHLNGSKAQEKCEKEVEITQNQIILIIMLFLIASAVIITIRDIFYEKKGD